MNPHHLLQNATPLSQRDGQQSWRVDDDDDGRPKVIRLFRLPERLVGDDGRLVRSVVERARVGAVGGVPRWRHFGYLDDAERLRLGLSGGPWLLAVRDFVEGQSLRERRSSYEEAPADDVTSEGAWLETALRVAYVLRELHERGWAHGDLQPGNIIVGPDEEISLIDVPLFATAGGERGHVAGSAPLMAPERWEGEAASAAADIYSLGTLVCWLASGGTWPLSASSLTQWAQAHRHRRPQMPDQLGGRLSGLVSRMLSKEPDMRPPLQALIDAARELGASAGSPAVMALGAEIDQTVESAHGALDDGAPAVVVVDRDRKLIASAILAQLARRLELAGEHVLHLRGTSLAGEASIPDDDPADPWALAYRIIERVSQEASSAKAAVRAHLAEQAGRGDQLHTFGVFTEALFEALPAEGLTVVWENFEAVGPDVARWWNDVMDQVAAGSGAPQINSVLGAAPVEVDANVVLLEPADGAAVWGRWRASTLRADVQDIAGGHWKQLVERAQGRPDRLIQLINERIGADFDADFDGTQLPIRDSGVHRSPLSKMGSVDGWRQRLDELVARGAFSQAAQCCRAVHGMRAKLSEDDRCAVLEAWTDVVLRGAGGAKTLERLERALEGESDRLGVSTAAALAFARLAHSQGRHREGLDRLEAVVEQLQDGEPGGELVSCRMWQAQLSLSSGQLDAAAGFAQQGLAVAGCLDEAGLDEGGVDEGDLDEGDLDELVIHLELIAHGAGAIGGDGDAISALEALLGRMDDAEVADVLCARCHAYRALGLTRHDRLDEATDAYRRALEIVESAGLVSELPIYLLNVGTAYHRQGRLGIAREYYTRGTRVARPSTRASTRALLWANQANIEQALGRLEEARASLERAWQVAREHELGAVLVFCHTIAGDIALADGEPEEALASYQAPLEDDVLSLPAFSHAELLLQSAEACLLMGQNARCGRLLAEARSRIEKYELVGLEGYHGMLRARSQWSEGGSVAVMAGIELFRRNLLQAARAGNHKLVLRQSPHLWAKLEEQQLAGLMEEVARVVQDSRNAIAMGLTRELREDFFAHLPALAADGSDSEDLGADAQPSGREQSAGEHSARDILRARRKARQGAERDELIERFYRMLSLNEIILNSSDLKQLTPKALEIALSLSGAERGFVLLRDPTKARVGEFRIVASRDVRGQPIPKPHLEVSLTVAEEAARTGQTVITLNAREDQRFEAALSVVDLNLTSVLCVPIRDSGGLLGALYLDHRFEPGVFDGELPRMMEAFGHQLALAITNVRRIEELDAERGELAEAKSRLDELLAEREVMLGELEERCEELTEEVERTRSSAGIRERFSQIAFASRAMEEVLAQAERVARSEIPLVVTGESGVGKELVARGIHRASPRKDAPFVAFNCGAVSESLLESEIFGHEKGAFTGAEAQRRGFFHAADGGTIFLDELGEMPLTMQVKLLRVLQEKTVRRVGATQAEPVDVRVVAATNRNLEEMVDDGTFREDLYYRLAAFVIEVPPLRERREDIPLIARTLLDRIAEEMGDRHFVLEPEGARLLSQARWPGNVRELENTLRAACALADGEVLGERELAPLLQIRQAGEDDSGGRSRPHRCAPGGDTRGRKPKAGRAEVVEALRRTGGDRDQAAEALGVSVRTLYRYLNKYEIE